MAEEEVIILEDEEEEGSSSESKSSKFGFLKDKKRIYIVIGSVIFLIVILLLLLYLFLPTKTTQSQSPEDVAQGLREVDIQRGITVSKLDKMITKANILYDKGVKMDALKIYEKIANFSESVSFYNLGVAKMKEDDYSGAIESFQNAINAGEDRCVSAINAAASALYLENHKLFRYYIDLAYAFLKDEANSKLYSYYYGLVMYYKNNFYESFSPLLNRTSDFYDNEQNHILANLYTLYNDNQNAINYLEKNLEAKDYLNLGLLYAREGMYDLAARNVLNAVDENGSEKSAVALELINLKRGYFQDASSSLNRLISQGDSTNTYYPLRAKLSDSLFDIGIAQERFAKDFDMSDKNSLKILFYFVNYMVFDAKKTKQVIQKGGLNIYIDEISDAKELLEIGGTVSQVNYSIALALEEVMKKDIRKANEILLEMTKKYTNHAVLHFNLALSYAQLGDYEKAYSHFLKSYHLDSKNILGGIYAIAAAKITNRDYRKILDGVTEDLDRVELSNERKDFIIAMINFIGANPVNVINWADSDNTKNPLHLSMKAMSSYSIGDSDRFDTYVKELQELLPDDLLVGIFELISKNAQGENMSEFALTSQQFFKANKYNLDSLYFGAAIVRELYIRLAYIAGTINYVKDEIEEKVQTFRGDGRGPLQALAFVNLYSRNFEESFVAYTTLVDNLDVKDSRTLFLGAVAAIGSGHHENAAANLELSVLSDRRNFESRYALGLLYQEADNLKGASAQFGVMGNSGFESEYFDFSIENNLRRDSGF